MPDSSVSQNVSRGQLEAAADRLYRCLALFDTRDQRIEAQIVRSAREGYERLMMGEDFPFAEFDAVIERLPSTTRRTVCPHCGAVGKDGHPEHCPRYGEAYERAEAQRITSLVSSLGPTADADQESLRRSPSRGLCGGPT